MVSCFGKRRISPNKSSLSEINVYPPPIKIQKSLVIPGFIREGRQLSRTLSLYLDVEDSISASNSESSLENRLEKSSTKNDLLKEDLSFKNYYQYLDLDYDNHQNPDPYTDRNLDPENEFDSALKYKKSNSNNYNKNPRNETVQAFNRKSAIAKAGNNIIVNPVNIKPREIKKVNNNQNKVDLSDNLIKSTNSFKESKEDATSSDYNFKDLYFNDYSASNDYIEKYVTGKKNMGGLDNDLKDKNIYSVINEPVSANKGKLISNKHTPITQTKNNNLPGGRKRLFSAPNEPIIHTEQSLNERLENKQVTKKTENRHRSPSLRILAQSVINLMKKRGSKGLDEGKEVKSVNEMLKNMEIQSSDSSEATLSRSPNSTVGSNSPSVIYQEFNSASELIQKLGSDSKKQVSFEMDLKKSDKKRSSKVSKKFSNLFGRKEPSKSKSKIEFTKKLSDSKRDYPNNDNDVGNYNSNTKNNIIFSEDGISNTNHGEFKQIEEFSVPINLIKSGSSETLDSNFSLDQRVARTYDMQILTYDQTPIPIPNLPRGRKLQSLENLENCYLIVSPNIPNILSSCYCR
ncbi:uncharacterized protein cubi_00041 [Cryptosporidium ubiquitum]|uniref:Uncharacterized protein n=1 Tax=Cryptosporidium ubiquitum TaxID=857276 RepID=A0A1J4MJT1_9CRYT|nr:uncharacterized protein cubi_00041 [Cryptosporidium ubiquitum]OII74488.1 hypothetical protein cubi_00041 [Cryptosporidium ubiquitum]